MKKIIALVLAALMMFALVSCIDDGESIRGNTYNDNEQTISSAAEDEVEVSLGSSANNVYENKFLGIGCKLDDTWTFKTDEEIRELNNLTQDMLGDEYAEQIKNAALIYDMSAIKNDATASINVNIENIGLVNGAIYDEESYIDNSLNTLKEPLESAGFENLVINKVTVDFGGKQSPAIAISAELAGVKIYEKVVCVKQGKYIACITVASYLEDSTDALIAAFYRT